MRLIVPLLLIGSLAAMHDYLTIPPNTNAIPFREQHWDLGACHVKGTTKRYELSTTYYIQNCLFKKTCIIEGSEHNSLKRKLLQLLTQRKQPFKIKIQNYTATTLLIIR